MEAKAPISLKALISTVLGSVSILLFLYIGSYLDHTTRLIMCQNNLFLMRIHNKVNILVDLSSSGKYVECLGTNLPFYDREIEAIFLSSLNKTVTKNIASLRRRYKFYKVYIYRREDKKIDENMQKKLVNQHIELFFTPPDMTNLVKEDSFTFNRIYFLYNEAHCSILVVKNGTLALKQALFSYVNSPTSKRRLYMLVISPLGLDYAIKKHILKLADVGIIVLNTRLNDLELLLTKDVVDYLEAANHDFVIFSGKEQKTIKCKS
jgi:hypothetical protein